MLESWACDFGHPADHFSSAALAGLIEYGCFLHDTRRISQLHSNDIYLCMILCKLSSNAGQPDDKRCDQPPS